MENASKALIIAGAILISILLISVGIMVMNSTNGIQDTMEQQMSSTAIQAYNSQFTGYTTGAKSASDISSLYELYQRLNATRPEGAPTLTWTMAATGKTSVSGLDKRSKYKVDLTYTNGYVSGINVTNNT